KLVKAHNGGNGMGNNCKGKNGTDLFLKVPLGTLVKDALTGAVLYDFMAEGDTWQICKGGKGGKGNSRFKTATHQAPFVCTPGEEGEACEIELELKLIADIGLVGMPNAGKSTLISKLARRAVKIAPYPFTTLEPNIGILKCDDGSKKLIADIPGIIDQASQDKGLGLAFLKHIERTSVLVYVVELAPYQERDPFEEFLMLRRELAAYDPTLLDKPFLVALNKIDQEEAQPLADAFIRKYPFSQSELFIISAQESVGLEPLLDAMHQLTENEKIS
ncbi:MAG: GTPase obg, partial [Chlamydiota bacterium]